MRMNVVYVRQLQSKLNITLACILDKGSQLLEFGSRLLIQYRTFLLILLFLVSLYLQ